MAHLRTSPALLTPSGCPPFLNFGFQKYVLEIKKTRTSEPRTHGRRSPHPSRRATPAGHTRILENPNTAPLRGDPHSSNLLARACPLGLSPQGGLSSACAVVVARVPPPLPSLIRSCALCSCSLVSAVPSPACTFSFIDPCIDSALLASLSRFRCELHPALST